MRQYRPTAAHISLANLANNIKEIKSQLSPGAFFCPMVKANAYGHGDVIIADGLENLGVKCMGVGLIEEGALLRQAQIQAQLLVFGVFEKDEGEAIREYNLTPVLSTWEQLASLERAHQKRPFETPMAVHVKFDTGMHRLGFSVQDADKLVDYFNRNGYLQVEGVLTHLACGEDASDPEGRSFQQLRSFQQIERSFSVFENVISHTLNSAGFINFNRSKEKIMASGLSRKQGVRPGLMIYGISPLSGSPGHKSDPQLRYVMSLRSATVRYHVLEAGEQVSYGGTWTAKKKSVIAVVPVGYADGYHRLLSNRASVLFRGARVPVAGTVCMDFFMIDVTDVVKSEEVSNLGPEEVTLFGYDGQGNEMPASELASQAQTIPWEILTSVGERVPRIIESGW